MGSTYPGRESEARGGGNWPEGVPGWGVGASVSRPPGPWLHPRHSPNPFSICQYHMRNKLMRNHRTRSPLGLTKAPDSQSPRTTGGDREMVCEVGLWSSLPRVPCTRPERPALTLDEVSTPEWPPGPKEIRAPLRKGDIHMDGLPVGGGGGGGELSQGPHWPTGCSVRSHGA